MTVTKDELKVLLKKRSGVTAAREAVKPVNLYEHKVQSSRPEDDRPLAEKLKDNISETLKSESAQQDKKGAKNMKKFASYVTADSYKKLKLIAVKNERKMYDVIQDAIDNYIETFTPRQKS
jgi:uncharacterized Rmd1/YagE family protein